MTGLLYYPTFLPPSENWIKQALLFWDTFSTIFPERHYQKEAPAELDYLREEGVSKPLSPYFYDDEGYAKGRKIVRRLDERLSDPEVRRRIQATPQHETYPVSNLKLACGALDVFERHDLLGPSREWRDWVHIKKPAALLYMSLLAELIAEYATNDPLQPCTDNQTAQEMAFEHGPHLGLRLVSEHAIPTVRDDATYQDILAFRRRRRDQLLRFRHFLDKAANDLVGPTPGKRGSDLNNSRSSLNLK